MSYLALSNPMEDGISLFKEFCHMVILVHILYLKDNQDTFLWWCNGLHGIHPQRYFRYSFIIYDFLCGLVVRVLGYGSRGPGSIPGTTREKKGSGSGTGPSQPREYN
jgi:hypothetical protein